MNRFLVALAIVFSFGSYDVFAQNDLSGITVTPTTDPGPEVDVDLDIVPIDSGENVVDLPTEWARFAGGVWGGTFGQGVFGTFPRMSSDDAFVDPSERGLGFGVQIDMGVKHSESQALRFRAGYLSLGLNPDVKTLDKHDYRTLEDKIKIVSLGVMYRWIWQYFPVHGVLWVGVGATANYVAMTTPKDPDTASVSKLRNTLGVGYQAVLGWDYPIVKYTDLGAEIAYHPFRSFSGVVSLRTSL